MQVATAGYIALVAVSLVQALDGRAPFGPKDQDNN
jgi:hypothetical protein